MANLKKNLALTIPHADLSSPGVVSSCAGAQIFRWGEQCHPTAWEVSDNCNPVNALRSHKIYEEAGTMPPDGVVVFRPRMRINHKQQSREEKWESSVFVDACASV